MARVNCWVDLSANIINKLCVLIHCFVGCLEGGHLEYMPHSCKFVDFDRYISRNHGIIKPGGIIVKDFIPANLDIGGGKSVKIPYLIPDPHPPW